MNLKDAQNRVTDIILEELATGTVPWFRPWKRFNPTNLAGRAYRGINRILLSMQNRYGDPRYLTYNKAKELGGFIRKGEHGFPIVLFKIFEKDSTDAGGNKAVDKIPFCRFWTVHNVEQSEGFTYPELEGAHVIDFEPMEEAQRFVDGWDDKPIIVHGANGAYYTPVEDKIVMPDADRFESPAAYYATLFKFLARSTGHPKRLNRYERDSDLVSFGREELTCEIASAFLLAEARIDTDELIENSAAYIGQWTTALAADPSMFMTAAGRAQRAMDTILGIKVSDEEDADGDVTDSQRAKAAA